MFIPCSNAASFIHVQQQVNMNKIIFVTAQGRNDVDKYISKAYLAASSCMSACVWVYFNGNECG